MALKDHSPLQLQKSGTKYVLPLELHHHSAVSDTVLRLITSPSDPNRPSKSSDCPHLRFVYS